MEIITGVERRRSVTAKMNDIDPQTWLADVLGRIAEHPMHRLDELLPWHWRRREGLANQAACLFIVDTENETRTAFTRNGVENLKQLILDRER